jgi:3-oxoacyl-[acyl-carrier-protein] synthase-3
VAAYLRSFGAYVPGKVVSNEELARLCGCEADWILSVSGIRERRAAEAGETTAVMGARAAEDCLARSGKTPADVGLIVCASGSMERRFPGPGAEIGQALGIAGVPVIDLPMASAGSIFGLALAADLSATYGPVLVVASERMTPVVWDRTMDRNTAILFGDGAGAALVTDEGGPGSAEIVDWALHSDGSYAEALKLEPGGPLVMNGQVVIMQASRKIPAGIQEVLDGTATKSVDVQVFLMHQANANLITRVAKSVGVGAERFYTNIERYGNTSSASMLIAAAEWSQEGGGFQSGAAVVFAGFGAGFHWGALLARGV